MLEKLLDVFFGCWHSRYSFPITVKPSAHRGTASLTGTYVVCLDCGKELAYDWAEMRVVTSVPQHVPRETARTLAGKQVA